MDNSIALGLGLQTAMAEDEWTKNWVRINKHRKATVRDWKNGNAKNWSAEHESHAQYNPLRFQADEAVKALELECVEFGTLIRASAKKRTFYREMPDFVGYCCGTLTKYVFAEWLKADGLIHGRPICEKSLATKGVTI